MSSDSSSLEVPYGVANDGARDAKTVEMTPMAAHTMLSETPIRMTCDRDVGVVCLSAFGRPKVSSPTQTTRPSTDHTRPVKLSARTLRPKAPADAMTATTSRPVLVRRPTLNAGSMPDQRAARLLLAVGIARLDEPAFVREDHRLSPVA